MALNVSYAHQTKRVAVTPGMTMLQVVEAAREQFHLDTTTQYELTHRGRVVDLSLPFRLTGISNNASMEMSIVTSNGGTSSASIVRVCVQLTNGKRVQQSVSSSITLEEMLYTLQLFPTSIQFSLIYLQRDISYDSFATTTLQDLGLLSGSAMFRMQQSSHNDTTRQPLEASVHFRCDSTSTSTPVSIRTDNPASHQTLSLPTRTDTDVEMISDEGSTDVNQTTSPVPSTKVKVMSSYDAIQMLRDSCFDAVARPAILTLMKIITNILSYPENEKMRSIRLSNAVFHRTVGQRQGGIDFLLSVGFVHDTELDTLVLKVPTKPQMEQALNVLSTEAKELNIDESEWPRVVVPLQPDASFDAFKSQITRMSMQPRGPSVTEVLVDTLKAKEEEILQAIEKPARNTTVTLPGQTISMSQPLGAVEDTQPSDASLLIASMRARRVELEKSQNFRTQAMRDLDELKRKKVFQTALLRVQFPDRVILQAAFHPTETVGDVMRHIQEQLVNAVAANAFYLYVSPPLIKLQPDKSLNELGLVPAAHTYLSWIDPLQAPTNSSYGWYLRSDLLTSKEAQFKRDEPRIMYPTPIALDDKAERESRPTEVPEVSGMKKPTTAKAGKKPGWLKL